MSSLIRWDVRTASWAAAMFAWLKRTHSSGVEDLQQEHSCDEAPVRTTGSTNGAVSRLPRWDPRWVCLQGYLR